jgi:hypothetical protein
VAVIEDIIAEAGQTEMVQTVVVIPAVVRGAVEINRPVVGVDQIEIRVPVAAVIAVLAVVDLIVEVILTEAGLIEKRVEVDLLETKAVTETTEVLKVSIARLDTEIEIAVKDLVAKKKNQEIQIEQAVIAGSTVDLAVIADLIVETGQTEVGQIAAVILVADRGAVEINRPVVGVIPIKDSAIAVAVIAIPAIEVMAVNVNREVEILEINTLEAKEIAIEEAMGITIAGVSVLEIKADFVVKPMPEAVLGIEENLPIRIEAKVEIEENLAIQAVILNQVVLEEITTRFLVVQVKVSVNQNLEEKRIVGLVNQNRPKRKITSKKLRKAIKAVDAHLVKFNSNKNNHYWQAKI